MRSDSVASILFQLLPGNYNLHLHVNMSSVFSILPILVKKYHLLIAPTPILLFSVFTFFSIQNVCRLTAMESHHSGKICIVKMTTANTACE